MSDKLKTQEFVSAALRGQNPKNPKLKPIEMRARGYQLYKKEAETMGETPVSYDEWIKTQQ